MIVGELMDLIADGFSKAFSLILRFDSELLAIIFLSLKVSGLALLIATLLGVPLGAVIALKRIPAKGVLVSLLNTLMSLPSVVVGLFVYLMLSRSGPLGFLGLLYTPAAMIVAQTILAFPIVMSLSRSAVVSVDPLIQQAAMTLGASPSQVTRTVVIEARYGIMTCLS